MKKISLYKLFIFIISFLFAISVQSQNNFNYKAAIAEIAETKFYKISLPPQVVANCRPGLEDIRIYDGYGKQVAYILKNDLPVFQSQNFTAFPILKTVKEKDKQTHITLQNNTNEPVNNLLLFVKNTDAQRAFSVSGSDDSSHWYVIKENIYLDNSFSNDGETIVQTLSFPKSNYKYFQLTILGENLLPFNIIKAGVYKEDLNYGNFLKINDPDISQKDSSDKMSYIKIHFDNKYLLNKIIFQVKGEKYFKRKFSLLDRDEENFITEGYLASDLANTVIVNIKTDKLLLEINNEDNAPLEVTEVQAFQLNNYLLTYLQAGQKYFLNFGDSMMQAPKYDLEFFSDSIGKNPSEISVSNIEKTKVIKSEIKTASKNNTLFLWIIIIVILVALTYFSFKMTREINKKEESNL